MHVCEPAVMHYFLLGMALFPCGAPLRGGMPAAGAVDTGVSRRGRVPNKGVPFLPVRARTYVY